MATKKQQTTEFKTWDQYVSESAGEPFKIPISEDETLVIDSPSGAGLMEFTEGSHSYDAKRMLAGLVGDKFDDVMELLSRPGSHKAMDNLIYDMMMHFDIAEEVEMVGKGGGKRKEKDPRKIRKLLNQGWRMAGEAPART